MQRDCLSFCSDIHLSRNQPEKTARFLSFLRHQKESHSVYILGDLFDFWLGPKQLKLREFEELFAVFSELKSAGVNLYFMGGNRDYNFDQKVASKFGIKILKDPSYITVGGSKVMLSHGDSLCLNDRSYRNLKRVLQNPVVKWMTKRIPVGLAMRVAQKLREKSRGEVKIKSMYQMDLAEEALLDSFNRGADVIVCGHIHRPRLHSRLIGGQKKTLIVLGHWDAPASYLKITNNQFALELWDENSPNQALSELILPTRSVLR